MKTLTNTICTVLLTLLAVTAHSQSQRAARPVLFGKQPSTINCTEAQLGSFFTAAKGESVNIVLPGELLLAGAVTSNLIKYSNLQTIVVQLSAFKNTLFSLSKQTGRNKETIYTGRIINPLYADGFELKRNASGAYQFTKIDTEKILMNCSQ